MPQSQQAHNAARRERYATDPAYREKRKAEARDRQRKLRADPDTAAAENAARKERYKNDDDYRERERTRVQAHRAKHRNPPED